MYKRQALTRHGVSYQDIDLYWTPGAWEQPVVAKEIALLGKYDAIITLGAVIRGDTTHHEYVAGEAAKGLAHVGLEHRVPVAFGILTCDNLEQALMRSLRRLLALEEGVRVHPGHGPSTTIGRERRVYGLP